MPLFECSKCHVVDNTALGNFWWDVGHLRKPALCCLCDPAIGKWHDMFPRLTLEQYRVEHPNAKPVEYPIGPQKPENPGA